MTYGNEWCRIVSSWGYMQPALCKWSNIFSEGRFLADKSYKIYIWLLFNGTKNPLLNVKCQFWNKISNEHDWDKGFQWCLFHGTTISCSTGITLPLSSLFPFSIFLSKAFSCFVGFYFFWREVFLVVRSFFLTS